MFPKIEQKSAHEVFYFHWKQIDNLTSQFQGRYTSIFKTLNQGVSLLEKACANHVQLLGIEKVPKICCVFEKMAFEISK